MEAMSGTAQGVVIRVAAGGRLVVTPEPGRPEVVLTALGYGPGKGVSLVLTHEERDHLVVALTGEPSKETS